jgi:hypothetical protein
MKMYLNGQLWHSETGRIYSFGNITTAKIGSNHLGNSNYNGIVDDFRIYDRALSEEEINNIFNE